MANKPSSIFSNGTEYAWFQEQFCCRCTNYKQREDGFAEFPKNGGCPILDKMEYARFDPDDYPSEWVRELTDATDGHVITWHYCIRFSNPEWSLMEKYFTLMKNAILKREGDENNAVD